MTRKTLPHAHKTKFNSGVDQSRYLSKTMLWHQHQHQSEAGATASATAASSTAFKACKVQENVVFNFTKTMCRFKRTGERKKKRLREGVRERDRRGKREKETESYSNR